MSDDKHEESEAAPLPDKAKIIEELHSGIQLTTLKEEGATAPSYEEAISSSYPVLPVESSSMQRAQSPMHYPSPPYQHSPPPPPVVQQPQPGNHCFSKRQQKSVQFSNQMMIYT